MKRILSRLALLVGRDLHPGNAVASQPNRSGRSKQRDDDLERRAREAILPLAPALSGVLVVGWNARMRTTAGVAVASRWEIWLNPALRGISPHEVERTLLHELAHLLAQHRVGRRRIAPHGQEWRQACQDLGIPGEGRTHQLPFEMRRMKRRYFLRCPGCGESHGRVRIPRRRIACLSCCRTHNRGLYDERFRFLVERTERFL
jgi:predicted SprT family Zn-dependent metalloprotease